MFSQIFITAEIYELLRFRSTHIFYAQPTIEVFLHYTQLLTPRVDVTQRAVAHHDLPAFRTQISKLLVIHTCYLEAREVRPPRFFQLRILFPKPFPNIACSKFMGFSFSIFFSHIVAILIRKSLSSLMASSSGIGGRPF